MTESIALRGMAWDHPRGKNPLRAISAEWSKSTGTVVSWDARPLKDFEDQALEELATTYDFVLIDHPFTQTAANSGLIAAVNDWANSDYIADQEFNSVGPSFASYTWAGKQWALAIDAACQVSATREDLRLKVGLEKKPENWLEVEILARKLHGTASMVALPLNPNHAYCAFLSVGVTLAGDSFWPAGQHVDRSAGREAMEFLRELSGYLHPESVNSDPIVISDLMSLSNQIIYVPLMFGYSNYARKRFRNRFLMFGNAPGGPSGRRGSVLGGVGLALSSRSAFPELAADLARVIASTKIQTGTYVDSGGQPGHAVAWQAPHANAQVSDFFVRTRDTMEQAFVRPRVSGHRRFQPLAGELLHRYIWSSDMSADECLRSYDQLCETHLSDWR